MKTVISNRSGQTLEVAKRWMDSLLVLMTGLFIPFLFVFGISYKVPHSAPGIEKSISRQNVTAASGNTAVLGSVVAERND